MSVSANAETDVLIIGAGPTGLVLALWLTHLGIRVRIIDKMAEPGTTSRALAVQARTLELYSSGSRTPWSSAAARPLRPIFGLGASGARTWHSGIWAPASVLIPIRSS